MIPKSFSRLLPSIRSRRPVLCAAFVLGVATAAAAPVDRGPDASVLPGVVVVQFKAGVAALDGAAKTGIESIDRIAQQQQVYRAEKAFPILDRLAAKRALPPSAEALQRTYYLRYDGPASPRSVAAAFAGDPSVAWAEPWFVYRNYGATRAADVRAAVGLPPSATPDDPEFGQMTHLQQVHLPEAWDVVRGEQGNPRVIIGISDGGTDWRHPDLMANVWTNPGEIPDNGVDDDENGLVDDVHGWNYATNAPDPTAPSRFPDNAQHGTSVAGVAAAVTDNGLGVAGASWNATFMPIGAGCPNDDDLICFGFTGIIYAAVMGADVVNASWGGPESLLGQDVIDFARDFGALVVAAAGNESSNADLSPSFPANYDHVLSVGGTAKDNDGKLSFSNYGRSIDVFAPGRSINTTWPDSQYGTISGTSFSSPLVAGIAALVKTLHPEFSVDQLKEQVRVTGDNIDAANPAFAGRLGQGRVNAFRAVTVDDIPAVRLTGLSFTDSGGNGTLESGETVQLTATFTNYLADAAGLTIRLASNDAFVTITGNTASVGALASGATADVSFTFDLASNTPSNRALLFFTEVSAGTYTDADVIRLVANETSIASHSSGPLQVSITDQGNIGFLEFGDGDSPGVGFRLNQRNLLFEGGLLVADGPGRVSDCVRRVTSVPPFQDEDLVLQPGTTLEIISPAEFTRQQGQVSLTDNGAAAPLGILISQDSYVDTAPANQDFMILRYTITNTTDAVLSNVYAGLFFDWDINLNSADRDAARFDEARQFGYIQDDPNTPSALAGAHLLTKEAPLTYRAIDNPTEIYGDQPDGGFTEEEKWAFLSDGVQRTTLTNTDASQIVGSGPYSIDPGASIQVAFAVVAGNTQSALLQNVDTAQALWDNTLNPTPTGVEDPVAGPLSFALDPVYPNPAVLPATFAFQLAAPSRVTLTVYDVLGREVQTLASGSRGAGRHTVVWDGTGREGGQVAGGIYFVRLTAVSASATFTRSQSVVVLK